MKKIFLLLTLFYIQITVTQNAKEQKKNKKQKKEVVQSKAPNGNFNNLTVQNQANINSLNVSKNADVAANIFATNITIANNTVTRQFNITGQAIMTYCGVRDNATINGFLTANNVGIRGNALINGNLTVLGTITPSLQGATGAPGPQGPQGPQGPDGNIGTNGQTGETGAAGPGADGSIGFAGFTGNTGQTGFTGNIGAIGAGPIGATGNIGSIGSIGNSGQTGTIGNSGQAGQTGIIGASFTGSTGNTGAQGLFGLTGSTGANIDFGPFSTEYLNISPTGYTGVTGSPGGTGTISTSVFYSEIANYNSYLPIFYLPNAAQGTPKFINLSNDKNLPVQITTDAMGSFILQNQPTNNTGSYSGNTGSVACATTQNINFYKNVALLFSSDRWKSFINNVCWFVTTQQGSKLVGTGSVNAAEQGYSVALSSDGNTLAIGGPDDNNGGSPGDGDGATWVFTRSNGAWSQQGNKLVSSLSGGAGSIFRQGTSVALSGDGNTLVSSAQGGQFVTIYVRTNNNLWVQQSNIIPPTPISPNSSGISLSSDGNTLAIGSPPAAANIGQTLIYIRLSNGSWTLQATLQGTGNTGASAQGDSVSLSADGNTIAIGGNNDNSSTGATWIFKRIGSNWFQVGNKLVGSDNDGSSRQGQCVSLSSDGNTLAVGGISQGTTGATWIFTQCNGQWAQQGSKLIGTGGSGASQSQGFSVSLSADGNTLAIGGASDSSGIGATWLFLRTNGIWTQKGSKLVGSGFIGTTQQGSSVALSADGNTLAVGGPQDNANIGATWIFI